MLPQGISRGKQEGESDEYMCIRDHIFSNNFSYKPVDFYKNINSSKERKALSI